jgi:hypothetical protein
VREASPETVVLADGFSCRTQIEQGTGRRALHVAQLIQAALPGRRGLPKERPEQVAEDTPAHVNAKRDAAAVVGVAAAGAAAGLALRHRSKT